MATMKHVADRAGVSLSTVSRVLSGDARISQATRDRVRKAMRELKFYPNAIASSLASQNSRTLGLVVERSLENAFANAFFPELIRGIGSVLSRRGYYLMLIMSDDPDAERSQTLQVLRSRRVDGVILTSSQAKDPLVRSLVDEDMKFVLIGRILEDLPVSFVDNDNVKIGYMATRHLLDLGYRSIAMISGDPKYVVSIQRVEGYRRALSEAGVALRDEYCVAASFTRESAAKAAARLLSLPDPPDAIFAADDTMASGVLDAIVAAGREVPSEIGLIGVNDDPLARLLRPALSTIRIPTFDMGVWAAQILLDLVENQGAVPRQMILPGTLVARDTACRRCTAARTGGKGVESVR